MCVVYLPKVAKAKRVAMREDADLFISFIKINNLIIYANIIIKRDKKRIYLLIKIILY